MPWTRWHIPILPYFHLTSQLKLDCATIHHYVRVLEPILGPALPIDLHALHEEAVLITQARRRNPQRLVPIDSHVDIVEPRRFDQVNRLCDDWIHAHHLPDQPAVQSACIRIARHAVRRIVEELIG